MTQTFAYYATIFYRRFAAYTGARLQEMGLNLGALFPILYVGKHPGCSQAELTAALGLDWGYSHRSVARLVKDGVLIKEKNGRSHCLNLSEKGQQAFELSHQVFFDWDAQNLHNLTPEEQETLLSLLDKAESKGDENNV